MTTTETKPATRKVPVLTLSAMVVGTMAGAGMLTPAFVLQRLAVFATVTVLSYGILPRAELTALRQSSMAGRSPPVPSGRSSP